MGLFSFLSESGKGCTATISSDQLVVEVISSFPSSYISFYSILTMKFVVGWSICLCFISCSRNLAWQYEM